MNYEALIFKELLQVFALYCRDAQILPPVLLSVLWNMTVFIRKKSYGKILSKVLPFNKARAISK